MSGEVVQAQYEQLDAVARRFGKAAEAHQALQQRVQRSVQALQNGGWQGRGSAAFLREMNGRLAPALVRLIAALHEAQRTTSEIKALIQQAEEEAARVFQGQGAASTPANQTNGGAAALAPSTLVNGAPVQDPNNVFQPDYMRAMIHQRIQGENSPVLNRLMERLLRNPPPQERDQILDQIADLRGVPRAQFHAQYQKYLAVLEARRGAESLHGPVDKIDLNRHGDFLGTTASLRYGKVVGDVFGLDPVFGSLLNPTGGLVGPGNDVVYTPHANDPVGMHGIFHDAAGYLYNYHDTGPGYDYLGVESSRNTADPLTGQRSGISWWLKQRELDAPGPDFLLENPLVPGALGTIADVGLDARQTYQGLRQGVSELANLNFRAAGRGLAQALDGVARIPTDAASGIGRTVKDTGVAVGGVVVSGAKKIGELLGF